MGKISNWRLYGSLTISRYNYIIVLPAEISAAAVLISYWTPASDPSSTCTTGVCSNAMWVGLLLIVVLLINFGGTRVYGEMEFWYHNQLYQQSKVAC